MSRFKKHAKKTGLTMIAIATLGIFSTSLLHAGSDGAAADAGGLGGVGSSGGLLAKIAEYTNGTLTNPPSPTPNLQNSFTTYASQSAASSTGTTELAKKMATSYFSLAGISPTSIPYANDLGFPALLGSPVFEETRKNADPAYNYLQFASGLRLTHAAPSQTWHGSLSDQTNYINYFGTMTAAQTFNGYVLAQIYSDLKNGIPSTQTTLVNQASDPTTWFATITTESIGAVLRQSLMYQSQTYILLTQILQTEKMLLAAQAINNTLIMSTGLISENMLMKKAIEKSAI
jgi:hypothetical protein